MKQKKNIIYSIKTKVALLVAASIFAATFTILAILIPYMSDVIEEENKNYLLDVVKGNGHIMEIMLDSNDAQTVFEYNNLDSIYNDMGIENIESSYTYIVDDNGVMLYHPTKNKVGNQVENTVVKNLIKDLKNGIRNESSVIEYEFNGIMKYAAFYIAEDNSSIIVTTADESEIKGPIKTLIKISAIIEIVSIGLFSIVSYIFVMRTLKPINNIMEILEKMSILNFKFRIEDKLISRKDEIGLIFRSIRNFQSSLVRGIYNIKEQSESLLHSSLELNDDVKNTASNIEQIDKVVEEIALGATSQAKETQSATENIILMGDIIEETVSEMGELKNATDKMQETNNEVQAILTRLIEGNNHTKVSVEEIYKQTNTTNESALKIREVTNLISDIASQTNLLSLNASIEAAHAGEHGKGFAIVAGEIKNLAEQSNIFAEKIEQITNLLIEDSNNAVKTMQEVKNNIENQNNEMVKINDKFVTLNQDIINSLNGIDDVSKKVYTLDNDRVKIVDIVQNLSAIAEENSASTEETSASVMQVNTIVSDISNNTEILTNISNSLDDIVNRYRLPDKI